MPETLLTVKEVAGIFRLHPKTIYQLVKKKKLSCIRIGRNIRFSPDAVKQFKAQ